MKYKPYQGEAFVPVYDLDESLLFYEKKMGLDLSIRTDTWAELLLGDQEKNTLDITVLHLRKLNNGQPRGYVHPIRFEVDDCEKATSELEEKGIEIDPTTRCVKNEREKVILTEFHDPNGTRICLEAKIK